MKTKFIGASSLKDAKEKMEWTKKVVRFEIADLEELNCLDMVEDVEIVEPRQALREIQLLKIRFYGDRD